MRIINEDFDKDTFELQLIKLGFKLVEETEEERVYAYGKLRCRISLEGNSTLLASDFNMFSFDRSSVKTFRKFYKTFEITLKTDRFVTLEMEF